MSRSDLITRLSYRAGYLDGLGWPFNWFFRRDIALHREAAAEISELQSKLRRSAT